MFQSKSIKTRGLLVMNSLKQGLAAVGLQAALNSITKIIQKKLQIQFLLF